MNLTGAVQAAVAALVTADSDAAATELALTYARAIDADNDQLEGLGPKLLATLEALGATPRARAAIMKGGADAVGSRKLDELRERRRARQRDTAAVDAAAT